MVERIGPLKFSSVVGQDPSLTSKVDLQGPNFTQEPADHVDFSNSTGIHLTCSARGVPRPTISWVLGNGAPATDVKNLRHVLDNGTLVFPPFPAEGYRQDVHSTTYRCVASNTLGTVISREVHLRAVVRQHYEVHVYDEYVILGNTAVLRCHIPSFVRDYVFVTSWTAEGSSYAHVVIENNERYSIFSTGELHVREVIPRDHMQYRCRTKHKLTGEVRSSTGVGRLIVTEATSSVPPRLTHSRSIVTVEEGTITQLPCAAQGYPIPTYSWYRVQDTRMSPVLIEGRMQLLSGTLQLSNVQVSDSGTYHCVVNNSVGIERSETILTVTVPLSVRLEPAHQVVDMGKVATFHCVTGGHPLPHISWWKDGKPLNTDRRLKGSSRGQLRLDDVQREDRGMYQCFVQNSHGAVQATTELRLGDAIPQIVHSFSDRTVQPKTSVSLRCVATGNPPPQIRWTLDDRLITSNEHFHLEEHISIQGDVSSFVNISQIRLEDGGEYRCIASNKIGQVGRHGRINVYGPPYIRPFRNITAVAGSAMVIRCHVTGYPIESISWERDDTILPINHRQRVYPNGTLVVQTVQRALDAGVYTCTAKGEQGRTTRVSVHVSVLNPPKISPFSFPSDIQQGMRGAVTCSVIHGDLPIVISWMKDGKTIQLSSELSVKSVDEMTSTLVVHGITPRHNGNYTCVASNGAASVSHTAELLVLVPPRWMSEPRDQSVVAGQSVTLYCQADGSPKPTISWKKAVGRLPGEYTPLESKSGQYKMHANGSLTLRRVAKVDEGYFLCQASNGVGAELSKVVYLKIHVPAHFENKSRKQTAKKGSNAVLSCEAIGDLPITVSWRTRNQRLDPISKSRFSTKEHATTSGFMSQLVIAKVEREDSDEFICFATNAFGRDEAKVELIVQEPPEAPKDLKVIAHSSRTVKLSWQSGYDGNSLIRRHIILFRPIDVIWQPEQQNMTHPGPETRATVDSLLPAVQYELRVAAENDAGVGEFSDPTWVTTNEEAPEGSPQNISVESVDSQTLRIQWKPPHRELWNGEIQGYHIGYRPFDSGDRFLFKSVDASAEPLGQYLLPDLHKFTRYAVVMRAFNRIGAGPLSEEHDATTLEDVPSQPPREITCAPTSSQSIFVSWKAPSMHTLHGVLRGYKITYKPVSDGFHKSKVEYKTTLNLRIDLIGLKKFTNYSIQLAAFTNAGDGMRSLAIYCRTDEDVPGPPADIKVLVMSSDAIIVSWRPPEPPNGIITKYTVYMRPLSSEQQVPSSYTLPPGQHYHEARGLQENVHYEFWVTASTAIGEGEKTRSVSKFPVSTVPARIASFPEKILSNRKDDVKLQCRAVGIPTPDKEWIVKGQPLQESSRMNILSDGSLLIMNLRSADAGNYTCRVQNIYADDVITHEITVKASPTDDYPPSPPILSVVRKTSTSLDIAWKVIDEGHSSIRGFVLNYKKDYGEWEEVRLGHLAEAHRLENLACGTRYQMYMTAYNAVGNSEPSDMVSTATKGSAPPIPEKTILLVMNESSFTIRPHHWSDGGCPFQSIIIEYKPKAERDWMMATGHVDPLRDIFISGLESATLYNLRLSASNDAGTTVVEYDVYTLGHQGELMESADAGVANRSRTPFYKDPNIIIPIIATIITIFVLLLSACCFVRCRRDAGYKYRPKSLRTSLVQDSQSSSSRMGEFKSAVQGEIPSQGVAHAEGKKDHPLESRMSGTAASGVQNDICPYATFQLPGCRYDESPNIRFHTFVCPTSPQTEEQQTVTMSQYSKVRKKPSPISPRCSMAENAQTSQTTLCQSSEPREQLNLVKSSTLKKQKEVPSLYPSMLLPSAPPAEVDSPNTDSDAPDIGCLSQGRPRMRSLKHVPDILDHRPDSSTSNETSSDEDNRSYKRRRSSKNRLNNRSQQAAAESPDDVASSPESTTEETSFSFRRKSKPSITLNERPKSTTASITNEAQPRFKKDSNIRSPTGLAAVEEELIALLKRGAEVSADAAKRQEQKADFQIRV